MRHVSPFLTLTPLAAVAILAASAQSSAGRLEDRSDVRIVSSFVAAGEPVPAPCGDEAQVFARNLVRYPRPLSWHWVLMCDEAGWRRFLRLSGRYESEMIYASTDLSTRTTYLRGTKFIVPYDLNAGPPEILAHELAHIQLRSPEEANVRELVRRWNGERKSSTE